MQMTDYPRIGERLYREVLPNGLRINIVPKPGFGSYFAAFATDYGGAARRFELGGELIDTPAGVAHFLEHKMFDLPDGDNAMTLLSANGADPNAFTSAGMTCYFFQCTTNFEDNLRLLLHFVSTPYFTEETVQKEQGIIAQEILMGEDSPDQKLYYNLLELLYKQHPIRDKVAGTVESIAEISAETLYNCHRAFYAPVNMTLCIAGDVDPERIRAIAVEELPQERGELPKADFGPEESLLPTAAERWETMSVSAPIFMIGAKLRPEKDGAAAMRQQLITALALRLLVGSSSPFYTGLYAKGLLSRDYDYEADFSAGTGTIIISGESAAPEQVLKALLDAAEQVSAEGIDPERFERSKRASFGARLRGLEDFENICYSLAAAEFDGYCALDAIDALATVEKAECEAFISENITAERLAMAVISPKHDADPETQEA